MTTQQPTGDRHEFNVRDLLALSKRINEDPSLVEDDWRAPFLAAFEMTESQAAFVRDLPPDYVRTIQDIFRLAADRARSGKPIKLRVVGDLTDANRRTLQLEMPASDLVRFGDRTIIDETAMPDASVTFPIACCCADCCCWHWCGDSNPCA